MTEAFITNVIGADSLNRLVTLQDNVQRIGLISDGILVVDPRYRLFYFDTSCQMLHVLNLTGEIQEVNLADPIPSGYIRIEVNGKYYINKIAPNSVYLYNQNGAPELQIHFSISFDKITGFYRQNFIPMEDIIKKRK